MRTALVPPDPDNLVVEDDDLIEWQMRHSHTHLPRELADDDRPPLEDLLRRSGCGPTDNP